MDLNLYVCHIYVYIYINIFINLSIYMKYVDIIQYLFSTPQKSKIGKKGGGGLKVMKLIFILP
jgi:hypothetical protein